VFIPCFSLLKATSTEEKKKKMKVLAFSAMIMALLATPSFAACPNKCSGHGKCAVNDICECMQNWIGGDCSQRQCSYTRAWHDTATYDDDAHYYAECGNRGVCDREKGLCECDAGYTGSGCRRMACPDDCSGHGTCEFIEEIAKNAFDKRLGGNENRKYSGLWDEEKIMGCKCDPGFEGHNCARRVCPKGNDPLTTGQVEMAQIVKISGGTPSGTDEVYFTYFDPYGNAFTTPAIAFGAYQADNNAATTGNLVTFCGKLQEALKRLPNNVLNTVVVSPVTSYFQVTRTAGTVSTSAEVFDRNEITPSTTPATYTYNAHYCLVKFQPEPGTTGLQNLLQCNILPHNDKAMQPKSVGGATGISCDVVEANPEPSAYPSRPLSELDECSNRGTCDYSTGTCKCFAGHMGLACDEQEALV
jgi:hypothetical protein